jgi:hypothetical protein
VAAGLIAGSGAAPSSAQLPTPALKWRTENNALIFDLEGAVAVGPQTSDDPVVIEAFERLVEHLRLRHSEKE